MPPSPPDHPYQTPAYPEPDARGPGWTDSGGPTEGGPPISRLLELLPASVLEQMPATEVATVLTAHAESHPDALVSWGMLGLEIRTAGRICGCGRCHAADRAVQATATGDPFLGQLFIVCEHCGNKRCPHAAWHGHPCTNSNEPGQPGSTYT